MKLQTTILGAILLVSADTPIRDEEKADVAALQGFWVLKTTEYMGAKAEQDPTEDELAKLFRYRSGTVEEREVPEDLAHHRTTMEIKGDTFERREWVGCFNGGEGRVISRIGKYKFDLDRKARMIEFWAHKASERGVVPWELNYTYRLDGDTLKLGWHFSNEPSKLPTTFSTDKDEEVVVLTYRREKK
jgi:hypothetical protein